MSQVPHSDPTAPKLEFLSVLGLAQPVSVEDVKQAYLEKVKTAHPDHGGDPEEFNRVHLAYQQAMEYAQFKASRMQWLGQWTEQYAAQQAIIERIRGAGGTVEVESVDWLTKSIGPDFATVLDRVAYIRLAGSQIDDTILQHLADERRALAGLRRLELLETNVTETGVRHLHACQSLESLDLSGTQTSYETVEELLAQLPELETIVLNDTGISWWHRKKLQLGRRELTVLP